MGRIKTMVIKRTSRELAEQPGFGKEFNGNKKVLGRSMPSKRMRNMIAGYITRLNRNRKSILEETEKKSDAMNE